MTDQLIIPLNGLPAGKNEFHFHAGKKFFEDFDNSEILDADIAVDVIYERLRGFNGLDCSIDGKVTVACDRCLEPLDLPVSEDIQLSVKFGPEGSVEDETSSGDGREVVFFPEESVNLDISQIVYDYICISLPIQRVHPEGECNPEVMKYLVDTISEEEISEEDTVDNSPFASLKDLLAKKKD